MHHRNIIMLRARGQHSLLHPREYKAKQAQAWSPLGWEATQEHQMSWKTYDPTSRLNSIKSLIVLYILNW